MKKLIDKLYLVWWLYTYAIAWNNNLFEFLIFKNNICHMNDTEDLTTFFHEVFLGHGHWN